MTYRYTSWDSVGRKDCYDCAFEANSPREAIEKGLELLQEELDETDGKMASSMRIVLCGDDIPDIHLWRHFLGHQDIYAQKERIRKAFPQYFEEAN
jgi:hypothetical protein